MLKRLHQCLFKHDIALELLSNDNDEENTVHASLLKKEEQLGWGSEAEEGGESNSDYDYMGNENQGKGNDADLDVAFVLEQLDVLFFQS